VFTSLLEPKMKYYEICIPEIDCLLKISKHMYVSRILWLQVLLMVVIVASCGPVDRTCLKKALPFCMAVVNTVMNLLVP
jgi:hypothetical protein